ncbi:PqqD family protein [Aliiruegeria sabulilitoris]|uniref:PqqD family protein n=1 Tax=Aliiruegeria sabulilitoris TaxID=1510458 RepID=UPI000833A945|nr:PqqD family protein [Aliiruegeria sabulilitoris]NDR57692.1 PqqD family protein [Pseudoruegeria sp. M32A2M]
MEGDKTVLLDMESGQYFGMDPVASFVWNGLKEGKAPAEIVARISEEFTDVPGSAQADVLAFLQELSDKKLISPNG